MVTAQQRLLLLNPGSGPAATGLWTPTLLDGALKGWWTADDHGTARMTDDGAGLISSWTDNTGAMAVTAATTARPTWGATSFNGRPGLTFDGTANCFVSTTLTTLPTGATAGEIWAIFQTTSASGISILCRYGGTTSATARSLEVNPIRARASDIATGLVDGVRAVNDGAPHVAGGAWAGTVESGRVDGSDFSPSASATIATLNTTTIRLRIGAANATSASNFFNGILRHLLITTTLTPDQHLQLEGWGAWDVGANYQLPASHPFRNRRP
jgi:hypothetical protein